MVIKTPPSTHPRFRVAPHWEVVKKAAGDWMEDRAMRLAASLAFYTMLSLAPILVLALRGVGLVFSDAAALAEEHAYLRGLMGDKAADTVSQMVGPLTRPGAGSVATILSIIVLVISASSVFGELQDSLNTIWEVKPKPGRVLLEILKDRFLSFALVLGVCFLLLVSLVIQTALSGLTHHTGDTTLFWHVFNFIASVIVETVLFGLIFKLLPDADVRWDDVWGGAITTGILFSIGKFILGWYLGRASTTSVYGAAGSLIAVLLWVYYSAQILFFGAELTQAHAHLMRAKVKPADNAVAVTEQERTQQGMPDTNRVAALADKDDRQKARIAANETPERGGIMRET
ncbi:MAG TPA: YihY/virulence factor BrkB family protein [Tepidisphaeraceae bacterium]|nr:YihY/virulence factor BrkB family protein [Tepidisphaeraceae bacterium]